MRILPVFLLTFFPGIALIAQETAPVREIDFSSSADRGSIRFHPAMPVLMQKAGARPAFWEYFWEFGDGSFSREENPSHLYVQPGDYAATLDATAHYDDGKKPKKKKRPIAVPNGNSALASASFPDVFDPEAKQAIAMAANTQPRAEEELTCIISYRNNGFMTTGGRLHLFYNEKVFPASHFNFVEAQIGRAHV